MYLYFSPEAPSYCDCSTERSSEPSSSVGSSTPSCFVASSSHTNTNADICDIQVRSTEFQTGRIQTSSLKSNQEQTLARWDLNRSFRGAVKRSTLIPSEARLYSGSIDLFRGHGGGHGPPLYPATSLAIAYQTHSEHLPSL